MADIIDVLNNMQGSPGLTDPLIDGEGFPRADVDLMECRKLRHRHACLQTDYKNLMKKLEAQLFGLHQIYKETNPADQQKEEDTAMEITESNNEPGSS